ncbi:hypothetical protein Aph01nite_59070 [Acrocarpospora phusangensis]|uniref:Uncharacterized protein n=1 Tax=Acrocarpospora phusangensis TaxID=1070424 RepID=A0A919QK05_9ACTN|nr:hypothetical protein [Acrocarpospora phusangensis]GIH27597.1 hypothetical protein Aph01nite_59070 [Acrocarpospora phusangensis]
MRAIELEAWARRVADRVLEGKSVEDSRVELKADWPEPDKAARRIAGHCNSRAGETVLWIIGVDEKTGVQGVTAQDMTSWWPKVKTLFDGQAPAVHDLAIDINGSEVVALAFDANLAPFVVRNPMYGKPGAGSIEREVPWRDGTSVRSATRADLVKLLLPSELLPTLELISGSGELKASRDGQASILEIKLNVYAVLPVGHTVVLPEHQCYGTAKIREDAEAINLTTAFLTRHQFGRSFNAKKITLSMVHAGDKQVILEGPDFFSIIGRSPLIDSTIYSEELAVDVVMRPTGSDRSVAVGSIMTLANTAGSDAQTLAKWSTAAALPLGAENQSD